MKYCSDGLLVELLNKQGLHFLASENFQRQLGQDKEWESRLHENEQKVTAAVKEYLSNHPFIFTRNVFSALRIINRQQYSENKTTLIAPDCYTNGLHQMVTPFYNQRETNTFFTSDPALGYMLLVRGLEEVVKHEKLKLPATLSFPKGKAYHGLPLTFSFGKRGKLVKHHSVPNQFIYFLDHEVMLKGLCQDLQERQSGLQPVRGDSVFYKLPRKK